MKRSRTPAQIEAARNNCLKNVRSLEKGFVPAAPIVRLVKAYCEHHDRLNNFQDFNGAFKSLSTMGDQAADKRVQILGTRTILAGKIGWGADRFYKLLRGRSVMIQFDIADKLLCEIDMQWAWHLDPELREVYQKVNLAHLDAKDEEQAA